jgi:DNA-binding beta-propeller fold protein YncE
MQIAKLILLLFAYCQLSVLNFGQTKTINQTYKIAHQQTILSAKDIKEEGVIDKISNWLLGDDNTTLIKPISLTLNTDGVITILDQGHLDLVTIDLKVGDIELADYKFPSLVAICKYKAEMLLFTDSKNNTIYYFDKEKKVYPLNDSLILNKPTGIGYVKSTKEIWVSETGTHSIVILDTAGNFIRRIGQRGTNQNEFNYPTSIWIDKNEYIYVVDAMNYRIQIFNKDGSFISKFGEQGDATGYFARPKGIATDSYGNIYVVDALFHNVQIFSSEGRYLYNFGGQGTKDGNFWLPSGIYIDHDDKIYVADSYNSRIQIFNLVQN